MSQYEFKFPRYPTSTYYLHVRQVFKPLEYEEPRVYRYRSRYSNLRRIINTDDNMLYHESFNRYRFAESSSDTYYTVNLLNKNRLDMISNEVYGTPNNWWIIALANNIPDPMVVPEGTVLRIPPVTSLYSDGGVYSNGY